MRKLAAAVIIIPDAEENLLDISVLIRHISCAAKGVLDKEIHDVSLSRYRDLFDPIKVGRRYPCCKTPIEISSHSLDLKAPKKNQGLHFFLTMKNPYIVTVTENAKNSLVFGLPGGRMEPEDMKSRDINLAICKREVLEETGMDINIDPEQQMMLREHYGYSSLPLRHANLVKKGAEHNQYLRSMVHYFIICPLNPPTILINSDPH